MLDAHTITPTTFKEKLRNYSAIFTSISPPRVSSTAFARVFWEHPDIRYYCHEPFEVNYYEGKSLDAVADMINDPLDLHAVDPEHHGAEGQALFIKEMVYQLGDHFPILAHFAVKPIIFLIRNPRLNVSSRIHKKEETGDSRFFPYVETGWELMQARISDCKQHHIPYLVVDASDFRNHPEKIFPQVFEALGLGFSKEMLTWQSYHHVDLDNLEGAHTHLYKRVLGSKGIQPANEPIPELDFFPEEQGFRAHVEVCMDIYERLLQDSNRVLI